MILVDGVETPIDELGEKLGITIPIEKIIKKPVFDINPALVIKDLANGPGATRTRVGIDFPPMFRGQIERGKTFEIRYCTNRTPKPETQGRTEIFSPRHVSFDGEAELFAEEDKAVFFWLHFYCKSSPYRKPNIPYEYDFVDDQAKADLKIANIKLKQQAMLHASKLTGNNLVVVAKGMKIPGVHHMNETAISAELMQYALDKPAEYLHKAQSQVNHIHGLIYDAIDRGIFGLSSEFNSKRWSWTKGVKKGEFICEISSNIQDEGSALVTHIEQNINEFLPVLIDTAKTINARANVEKVVENIDVLGMLNDLNPDDIEFGEPADLEDGELSELPKTYKEAQEYLGRVIGKKTPALASSLLKAIQDKEVNERNIENYAKSFLE